MAKLTKEEILHIARLAKLDLSEDEIKKITPQLSNVLNHFSELSEVNTENTEPTSQTTGLEDVYRIDVVNGENMLTQEESLSGSDKIYNGYFKVKAILEGRTDK